jgi:predicted nucleic acid-binding protein
VSSRPVAILDACVLINLLASGRAQNIMSESGYQFGICSVVKNESIYLRATDSSAPPEEVKLDPYIESNRLTVYELSGDAEKELYVDYAAELDDGEAMSLALVHSRGFSMASDDRKARRLFMEEIADLKRLLSTSQILKDWSEKAGLDPAELKQVLTEVSRRGRFFPNSGDTHFAWWSKAMV